MKKALVVLLINMFGLAGFAMFNSLSTYLIRKWRGNLCKGNVLEIPVKYL